MHRESKAQLTDRLRREGRWEAFVKRREELKAEGVPAKEARWQAATEFPPPTVNGSNGSAPKVDLSALKGKPAVSIMDAAAWVFENLATGLHPPTHRAPEPWSLLQWARSSMMARSEFYRSFANRVVSKPQEIQRKADDERQEKRRSADARVQATIESFLGNRHKQATEQDRAAVG